jgi:hypothetical protein
MGSHLIPSRAAKRDAMWKEMLGESRPVHDLDGRYTRRHQNGVLDGGFRRLFPAVCNHEGWGNEARDLMRWVITQQEKQQADTRVILNLLTGRLRQQPTLTGKYMTATAWTAELQLAIPDHEQTAPARHPQLLSG